MSLLPYHTTALIAVLSDRDALYIDACLLCALILFMEPLVNSEFENEA